MAAQAIALPIDTSTGKTNVRSNARAIGSRAMTLAERIQARMRKLGLSQSELARRVGLRQSTINALVNGDAQGSKHLHQIARALETSAAFLLGETEDPQEGAAPTPSAALLADQLNLAMIPELRLGYSMGGGSILDDYEVVGFRAFDRDWLRAVARGGSDRLIVATGEGDSMEPTLKDGDTVLIDMSQRDITSQDRIWALSYGDLGMIKRVRRQPGGTYRIMSDNPTVAPIEAADGEMFVVGRVIWIGRRM